MSDFNTAFDLLCQHEGGYVNNPNDPGGPTKYGISLRFLKKEGHLIDGDIDNDGDIDMYDIKNMTKEEAYKIYDSCFWSKNNIDQIDSQELSDMIFGLCVNMGSNKAIKLLQEVTNKLISNDYRDADPGRLTLKYRPITVDGSMGEKTIRKINSFQPERILCLYKQEAKNFYVYLTQKNKKLLEFLDGWIRRVNSY